MPITDGRKMHYGLQIGEGTTQTGGKATNPFTKCQG